MSAMTPDPTPATWITIESTPEGLATRSVALIALIVVSVVLGLAFRDGMSAYHRGFQRAAVRSIGREAPPDWIETTWLCAICRSVNVRSAVRCASCRSARGQAEAIRVVREAEPDVIPESIDGAGARVTLEHNGVAHQAPLETHWRILVNGRVFGSAAQREGAIALLRAVRGSDIVFFDPRGAGIMTFPVGDLIAALERSRSPLRVPCPEMLEPLAIRR